MASEKREFKISFRGLLSDVTKALKWPDPIYSQANLARTKANLVLARGLGPNSCLFRGEPGMDLAESEEQAAEQAVDFLIQKKQVIIDDINLEMRNMYKSCCHFFKQKSTVLESIEKPKSYGKLGNDKKKKVNVPASLPKIVSADLWAIWIQVVAAYKITADEVDFITQADGSYVCCFTVTWPDHASRERYFIGDSCYTVDRTTHSLAMKAIQYFQKNYGFSVKDANFNRMKCSQIQCGFQRRRYLFARERHICLPADLESVPLFIADGYRTSEGPSYGIRSGLTLPPPSKKPRAVAMNPSSGPVLRESSGVAATMQSSAAGNGS